MSADRVPVQLSLSQVDREDMPTTKMAEPSVGKMPRVEPAVGAVLATQRASMHTAEADMLIDTMSVDHPRRHVVVDVPMAFPSYQAGQFFYERQCYDEYYTLLVALLEKGTSCVTLTGTAESGMTTFYMYFVERYRKTHADVRVLAAASSCLGIVDVTVFEGETDPHTSDSKYNLETFIRNTSASARIEKKPLLQVWNGPPATQQSYGQTVVITSPDADWFQSMDRYGPAYYMPLWTREELHEAARVLDLQMDEATVDERFQVFGGTPRYCLHTDPAVVERAVELVVEAITCIISLSDLKQLLVGTKPPMRRMLLVHFEPGGDGVGGPRTTRLASSYVEEKLAAYLLLSLDSTERRKVRAWLPCVPWAAGLLNRFIEGDTQDKAEGGGYWRDGRKRSRPDDSWRY